MMYYFLSLLLCAILSLCLFVMLLHRLKINREYKNRHALSYMLPAILMIAFIYFSVTLTVPRVLDLPAVITGRFQVEEAHVDFDDLSNGILLIDGSRYFYDFVNNHELETGNYKVSYTPRSRYIISMERIAESAENLSAN